MCILRVFPERLHGFFGKLRNCCACSFSASILSLYLVCVVLCLGAKTPVPFFLGFLCKKKKKKKPLAKKKRVARGWPSLFVCIAFVFHGFRSFPFWFFVWFWGLKSRYIIAWVFFEKKKTP
jgi:hypothetical protein